MWVLAVAKVLVVDANDRLRRHDPAPFLDDWAFERSLPPFVAYDLVKVVAVEDAAHDILRTGLQSTLKEGDLQPRLGHGESRRGACGAGADNHRVELFVVGH